MKKKNLLLFMVSFMATAFILAGTPNAHAAPIKLTYSNFFGPTHIQSKVAEAWCKEVEKRTNGRVKVEYYPGQTLSKGPQIYDGVVTGLSDLGFCLFGYTRGRFPVMEAVDLPLGYTSGKVATKVVNKVYKKFMPKELTDTEVMYLHAHGPGILHTKGKAVKKVEDLKGMKIRGHGTIINIIKSLGGTAVSIPMPELYQSLQKGVVDGALYPMEVNKGWKMGEVTKYDTACFSIAYTSSFFVVMNKGKWNKLPDDIKKIIEKINEEWIPKHGDAWDNSDMEGIYHSLRQGHEIIGLDKKEAARWKKFATPVIDGYITKMEKKGFKNAKEIADFTISTLNKYQK